MAHPLALTVKPEIKIAHLANVFITQVAVLAPKVIFIGLLLGFCFFLTVFFEPAAFRKSRLARLLPLCTQRFPFLGGGNIYAD